MPRLTAVCNTDCVMVIWEIRGELRYSIRWHSGGGRGLPMRAWGARTGLDTREGLQIPCARQSPCGCRRTMIEIGSCLVMASPPGLEFAFPYPKYRPWYWRRPASGMRVPGSGWAHSWAHTPAARRNHTGSEPHRITDPHRGCKSLRHNMSHEAVARLWHRSQPAVGESPAAEPGLGPGASLRTRFLAERRPSGRDCRNVPRTDQPPSFLSDRPTGAVSGRG